MAKLDESDFKFTNCKGCKTKKRPLFARLPFRRCDDYWCKECITKNRSESVTKINVQS